MKLTKHVSATIAALLLLAACNSEQEAPQNIVTNVPITYATGSRLTANTFEDGDAFGVWANYRTDNDTLLYIDAQEAILTGETWVTSKNYCWPSDNTLDFYAVYPIPNKDYGEGSNEISFTMLPKPTLTYKINNFSEGTDLMVATAPAVECPSLQPVPLHFKHVLSRLDVKITNNCNYGIPLDVLIDSIIITGNMHTEGTLNWETMTMQILEGMHEQTFTCKKDSFEINAKATSLIGKLYFIPEEVGELTVKVIWWTLLNAEGTKIKAGKYEVEKKLSTTATLKAGSITPINIVLTRKDDSTSGGDVTIN